MDNNHKAILKKKKTRYFETYITRVLKKISNSNGVTANSKQQLNSILCHISKILCKHIHSLTEIAKKKTISEKEVKNSINIIIPENLAICVIKAAEQTVESFEKENKIKGISRQEKAGISFPPSVTEKFLRNFGYSKIMVTSHSPVFLAGALEYITIEILKCASVYANNNKHVRITVRDLELGVRNNKDLDIFFVKNKISFLGGGVKPFIHSSLLSKKNRKKRIKSKSNSDDNSKKKKHRFRPGTVSLREIKRFQKMSNCLILAKFPFEKIVRKIVTNYQKDNDHNMKISKDVFTILQYFIEQRIVSILQNANFAAIHAGRVKLMPIDINLVQVISNKLQNPYEEENNENITEIKDVAEEEDVAEEN